MKAPAPLPPQRHLRLMPGLRRPLLEELQDLGEREPVERVNGPALLAAAAVALSFWAAALWLAVAFMQRAGWWTA